MLFGVVAYYVVTHDLQIYQYVEPFWMFGLFGTPALWTLLAVLLVATVFVRNLYCRFLCPVGATLGLMSYLTVFRIKRWSECNTCRICEKACEWGAIEGPKILVTECVRCDDCERLYADTATCPHWRIIDYNNRKIAQSCRSSRLTTAQRCGINPCLIGGLGDRHVRRRPQSFADFATQRGGGEVAADVHGRARHVEDAIDAEHDQRWPRQARRTSSGRRPAAGSSRRARRPRRPR